MKSFPFLLWKTSVYFPTLMIITLFIFLFVLSSCSKEEEVPQLSITAIAPDSGRSGTQVVINGTGFSSIPSENMVTINDKVCAVTNATATQLTIIIPVGAGSGLIKVIIGDATVESSSFEYEYTITVTTLAGSTFGSVDGTGTNAKFISPSGLTTDGQGNVYVADGSNIRKVTPLGIVTTFLRSNNYHTTEDDLYYARDVATDAQGNVYMADEINHKIRKITPQGEITTLAGSSSGYVDGTVTEAKLTHPTGVATDAQGNVYVADDNKKIRKITPAGLVTTLAGSTFGDADGTGTEAKFRFPNGMATDADGNVYVADISNDKIRKISPQGVVTTLAGSTIGYADGTGSEAKFRTPYGVTIDAQGNVYVADSGNHKIRKITPEGVVTTLIGTSYGYEDGTGTDVKFAFPQGLAIDAQDNIYVADTNNKKIRKITIE